MNRKMMLLIAGILIVVVVVAAAVGSYYTWFRPTETAKFIKIGAPMSLTGVNAYEGQNQLQAMTLAQEEINAAGGISGQNIDLIIRDIGAFDPAVSRAEAVHLVTVDKVDAVVTYGMTYTDSEVEVFRDYGVPYIFSSSPQALDVYMANGGNNTYWMVFNVQPHVSAMINPMFDLVENSTERIGWNLPSKKLALISSTDGFSVAFADYVRNESAKRGWQIVVDEQVPYGNVYEWGSVLAKIRNANPSFIIDADWIATNQAAFLLQYLEAPTNSLLYLQYGASTTDFMNAVGTRGDGILWSTSFGILPNDAGNSFKAKYKARWGAEPTNPASAQWYALLYVYANAAKKVLAEGKSISDHRAICDAVAQTDMQTPCGRLVFDLEHRYAISGTDYIPCPMFQMQNGTYYWIDPAYLAQKDFMKPPWIQ